MEKSSNILMISEDEKNEKFENLHNRFKKVCYDSISGGSSMQKILIVEDDLSIQALLHDFIQEAGYSVVLAADGVEALARYSEQPFDLILLDIMLPKIDGYGVCEVIRQKSDIPIIMLTALDDEENQLKGLDLQADDYITKPFSMPVLLRKIAAVLRRSSKQKIGRAHV